MCEDVQRRNSSVTLSEFSKRKFDSSIKRIVQLMSLANALLAPVAQGIVNVSSFCDSDDFLAAFSGNATLNLCGTQTDILNSVLRRHNFVLRCIQGIRDSGVRDCVGEHCRAFVVQGDESECDPSGRVQARSRCMASHSARISYSRWSGRTARSTSTPRFSSRP
jgi:hypothetical protein